MISRHYFVSLLRKRFLCLASRPKLYGFVCHTSAVNTRKAMTLLSLRVPGFRERVGTLCFLDLREPSRRACTVWRKSFPSSTYDRSKSLCVVFLSNTILHIECVPISQEPLKHYQEVAEERLIAVINGRKSMLQDFLSTVKWTKQYGILSEGTRTPRMGRCPNTPSRAWYANLRITFSCLCHYWSLFRRCRASNIFVLEDPMR